MVSQPPPIPPRAPPPVPGKIIEQKPESTSNRKHVIYAACFLLALLMVAFFVFSFSSTIFSTASRLVNSNSPTRKRSADETTEAIQLTPENADQASVAGTEVHEDQVISKAITNPPPNIAATQATENADDSMADSDTTDTTNPTDQQPTPNEAGFPDASAAPVVRVFNASKKKRLSANGQNPFLIAAQSKSTVFVIDKSSSMEGDAFHQVSEALLRALTMLKAEQSFSIIFFDDSADQLQPASLLTANDRNKQVARDFVTERVPSGGTQPYAAINMALTLNPDSVLVLSDGDFAISEVVRITEQNLLGRNITIHCIGLEHSIPTLKRLAEDNGGTYTTAKTLP